MCVQKFAVCVCVCVGPLGKQKYVCVYGEEAGGVEGIQQANYKGWFLFGNPARKSQRLPFVSTWNQAIKT
jgi:hypothetical protein